MSVGWPAPDVSWPKSPWCQLAKKPLTSVGLTVPDVSCQTAPDISCQTPPDFRLPNSPCCHSAQQPLTSVGQTAPDISWPNSPWHKLAIQPLMSFGKTAPAVSLQYSPCHWHQLTKQHLMSVCQSAKIACQIAPDISWPNSPWHQLAKQALIPWFDGQRCGDSWLRMWGNEI